ncbi:MAG TPA: cytochrome ubiquinol oxidase subunit I, partial [Gammaproteobacteria bacterium]|nr:cytochrome ubiquinol oxidase subunit I [Gammaproteobacteria bacterium]
VVSGITMSFQFGTNWPGFIERAGNITGPLLGFEVLTAFFIEATFLAIMLFGKGRVSNGVHLTSTALVAIGTTLSACWILSLNAWMQTPRGYEIVDGTFVAMSWLEIIFNPSFPYRFAHMLVASLLTSAFLIAGISAARMIRKVDGPATLLVLKTGVGLAAVLAPLQIVIGDLHGLNTLEHQPAKIAAIEGIWETGRAVPLTLVGFPDEAARRTHFAIEIPYAASLILAHDADAELLGLDEFEGDHPPVAIVFWSFRIMVGVGVLMLASAWWASWSLFRGRAPSAAQLRALSLMTFSGWIGVLAGWYVAEVGRQPWLIQGLMRTTEAVAPQSSGTMLVTLLAYAALYLFLLVAYVGTLRYLGTKPAA